MTTFSEFYKPLRLIVGDLDPYEVYRYQDGALDIAVRAVFQTGRNLTGYELNGDRATSVEITPDIPSGDAFALILYEAALMLMGGEEQINYRTRALSRSSSGDRKRDLWSELRMKIYEIRAGGEQFVSVQSFMVWLQSSSSLSELLLGSEAAPTILSASGIGNF